MGQVTYIEHDGTEHQVEISEGTSVMEGALANGVPGIDADCGGACACATCHVQVAEDWFDKTGGPASELEEELLELAPERGTRSRLSCQIPMTPELDGLIVHLPESQH